jgi:hypothetical protein
MRLGEGSPIAGVAMESEQHEILKMQLEGCGADPEIGGLNLSTDVIPPTRLVMRGRGGEDPDCRKGEAALIAGGEKVEAF